MFNDQIEKVLKSEASAEEIIKKAKNKAQAMINEAEKQSKEILKEAEISGKKAIEQGRKSANQLAEENYLREMATFKEENEKLNLGMEEKINKAVELIVERIVS